MATRCLSRSVLTKLSLSTTAAAAPRLSLSSASSLLLRPISAAALLHLPPPTAGIRSFSTRTTSSSLADPQPNWSNRPPKETILLDGCDFEHWLVVVEKPQGDPTRDEIIDYYIKTLASVIGSEDEARMKIYSVSTRCYYAFGALVSEELSYKLKELPTVRWVLPDSYLDVRNKDYGGEPFIDGQAVPYDPKYHEDWIRNHDNASRRKEKPRNFDRSRNFQNRRENIQTRDIQNRRPPQVAALNMGRTPQNPAPNMGGMPQNSQPHMGGMHQNPSPNMGGMPPNNMVGMPHNNIGGMSANNMGGMTTNNMGGVTPNYGMPPNMGGSPPNMGGMSPPNSMRAMPPNNMGGMQAGNHPNYQNSGGMPPNNMGGMQTGHIPNYQYNGGMPPPGQSNREYPQNMGNIPGGAPYQR